MRLAGQEKMGYYPTPLSQVALIASWLGVEPGQLVRLLDPCVGEGEALAALAQALRQQDVRVETWGVELSPGRAEKAAACLDRVLPTAWEQARVREGTVSLLFENPPYDHEGIGDSRRQCDLTGLSHNLCEYSAHDFCENRIMLVLGFAHTCGPYLERYPLRQML